MGFFNDAADDASNQALPGGNLAKPLIIAAGALLLNHFLKGRKEAPAPVPEPANPNEANMPDGGLLGGLGGLLEGFRKSGQTQTVDSWIGKGPNQPIGPADLGNAAGQQTISDIARKLGVNEQDLLDQLSRALPGMVDKMTPQGRLPTQDEIDMGYRRR